MNGLRKIRLVLALVVGLPCLMFVGAMLIAQWWTGKGTLRVHAPLDEGVTVSVDGAAPEYVAADADYRHEVRQGAHHVDVGSSRDRRAYDVSISNGFWDRVLPATSSQCWVDLDVYDVYYAATQGPPKVKARHDATQPFDTSGAYLSPSMLPQSVSEGGTVHLLRQMPCSYMAATDEQIIAVVGTR